MAKERHSWTAEQIKFLNFLARGKTNIDGEKRTMEQFSKAIGVHPATLYRWQELPGFAEALLEASLRRIAPTLPAITNGLTGKAAGDKRFKNIDTPAATLVLKLYGALTDKQKVESEVNATTEITHKFANMPDDELDKIIAGAV